MLQHLKDELWQLKFWLTKKLITYPKQTIATEQDVDYDTYWKEKRGEGGSYLGKMSSWQKQRGDIIANVIGTNDTVSILDIACGQGEILNYMKQEKGVHIDRMIGADNSKVVLEAAKEYGLETHYLDIREMETFEKLPNVDYSMMLEILEHIPNPEQVLEAAYAKSSKGVFVSIPNTGFIIYRLRLFFIGSFPVQWRIHPSEHLRFWTVRDLKWWLKALGHTDYTIYTYEGLSFFKWLGKVWPSLFAMGIVVYIPKK